MEKYSYASQSSSQRPMAMVLALVSAVVLSPIYINRKNENRYEQKWSSGFVLPMVLAGLIVAIKTTSSSNSINRGCKNSILSSAEASSVHRVGGSSWGLAGILVLLMFVLSWQNSVQHFLWR
ncbi:hypothetical protein LIER_18336 [Lithospermum erythrorhizon]|uniref:Uncharacterized protein n=1 Tax=Lithospermum erythrorhizon TaxID=34254 RepID=A0AAV3QDM7_LITER